jgi:predicted acetylornithine/succinylornithine family transaminase
MSNEEIARRHKAAVTENYSKLPVALVRGAGTRLWDADGKEYLDFFAGFGGTILGHCHPALVNAINTQAGELWAVGNQFYTEPQVKLAEHLRAKAFDGRAFFCHSGAESAEAAFKLARLAAGPGRFKIISALKGFHGRTMGALSATPGPYQDGFGPLVPGFVHVPYNDVPALQQAIDNQTAAVMLEPIQGEGGINMPSPDYLPQVRALCDQHNISLIFDEVWTGVGRTGKYFGHQHFGVTPDIMTMGKALGGGVPVGGILAKPATAALLKPGTHGCTLGGNPICTAVAAAVFDTLEKEHLVEHADAMGTLIQHNVRNFRNAGERIIDVRGKGLMIGIETRMADATPILQAALAKGLIINVTRKNVIRLSPALIVSAKDIEKALTILEQAINSV